MLIVKKSENLKSVTISYATYSTTRKQNRLNCVISVYENYLW